MSRPMAVRRGREHLQSALPAPGEHLGSVRSEAADDGTVTIRLYGAIDSWGGYWGISAKDVLTQLEEHSSATSIALHINSPGGEYFEGVAIHNLLQQHPAQITGYVDGMAASAASVIAMAASRLVMGAGAQLMIHDASAICIGNPDELHAAAEWLDAISQDAAGFYARRAGGDVDGWRDAMRAETWYTAAAAVEAGLADETAAPDRDEQDDEQDDDTVAAARWAALWLPPGRAAAAAPAPPEMSAPAAEETPPASAAGSLVDLSELIRSAVRKDTPA